MKLPPDSSAASNELASYHPADSRPPLRNLATGEVFCAYSLDDPRPTCPHCHRGPDTEVTVMGSRCRLARCYDSRLKSLPPTDYLEFSADPPQRGKSDSRV